MRGRGLDHGSGQTRNSKTANYYGPLQKFVKNAFLHYNPNFRYVLCLDKDGQNEFSKQRIDELEEQVHKWAVGEEPT